MKRIRVFVFPGLDGTDRLLERFAATAPSNFDVQLLRLPDDSDAGYSDLVELFSETLQSKRAANGCVVVAESFSGPLAVLLAHGHPGVVTHLVLVSSFVSSPAPFYASWIPWRLVFRFPLPAILARRYLVGKASSELVEQLQSVVRQCSWQTLSNRVRMAMEVDVSAEFRQLQCQVTYIQPKADRLLNRGQATLIMSLNSNAVVKTVEGPHLLLQTKPLQVWECIADRIAKKIPATESTEAGRSF